MNEGKTAYPAAIDATRRLHEAGCRLFIISNSSRRSGNTLKKLEPMVWLRRCKLNEAELRSFEPSALKGETLVSTRYIKRIE